MKDVFVLTAYRWGDCDNHSFVLGVKTDQLDAYDQAISYEEYRGGKYGVEVVRCTNGVGASATYVVRECYDESKGFVNERYKVM